MRSGSFKIGRVFGIDIRLRRIPGSGQSGRGTRHRRLDSGALRLRAAPRVRALPRGPAARYGDPGHNPPADRGPSLSALTWLAFGDAGCAGSRWEGGKG
jgi:hypothetical protein